MPLSSLCATPFLYAMLRFIPAIRSQHPGSCRYAALPWSGITAFIRAQLIVVVSRFSMRLDRYVGPTGVEAPIAAVPRNLTYLHLGRLIFLLPFVYLGLRLGLVERW